MIETGIRPLWRENARTIATIVARCPTTQVYAASGWALGPAAETHAARREDRGDSIAYLLLSAAVTVGVTGLTLFAEYALSG